jgi:hypothetical protein
LGTEHLCMRVPSSLPNEAATSGRAQRHRERRRTGRLNVRDRFGGAGGNEILTSATAVVLTGLLVAEGVTIVNMHGLVTAHMSSA